ncbi:MAG: ABC transporter permease [Acidimicrobiia bacterium]|nr:ABC transporter permease [Acidimicrobiia bacterium]
MSSVAGRLRRQVLFDLLIFRRNPASTFFTVILPLIFLVIFTSIFGNETLANGAKVATLYVPGILALAIISATTVNLAITMTARRERGILKRVRGTPMPPWVFVASQAVAGFALSVLMTVLITFVGWLLFGVTLNGPGIPSLIISVLIGAMSFAVMGLALTAIIPSEEAAPAVTNALMLPLYFISDVFIPGDQIPDWVQTVADLFPVKHLSLALQESFDPFAEGAPWPWENWLVIAVWGAVAALVAIRGFRWTPRR